MNKCVWKLEYSYVFTDVIYQNEYAFEDLKALYNKINSDRELEVYGINLYDITSGNIIAQLNYDIYYYKEYAEEYFGHKVNEDDIIDYILEQVV